MLIQFSVENFKSIKERVTLSFEASSDKMLPENFALINAPKTEKVLKTIMIYGANASGKSNIFSALTSAIVTIRNSNLIQPGTINQNIVPFKFSPKTINLPTFFEFVFIGEDDVKYVYRFSTTQKEIIIEELFAYFSAKPTMIFKRNRNIYDFSSLYDKKLKPLSERTADNKLFLTVASSWNCKETMIPFNWFMNSINTYSNRFDEVLYITGEMFENDTDDSLKTFTVNLLKHADINISDYNFLAKEIKVNGVQNIQQQPFSGFPSFNTFKQYEVKTKHFVDNGEKKKEYELNFYEESLGTQSLFLLCPIIKKAFEIGETLCIDEFDTSLHPLLVEYIISLFNNPKINKHNAQLLTSVHNTESLDLNKVRRDQVYFVNKDRKTGITDLYSLDEFSVRKSDKIRNEYLLGRYDAIPNITPYVS